jgi:hypothetical protein
MEEGERLAVAEYEDAQLVVDARLRDCETFDGL